MAAIHVPGGDPVDLAIRHEQLAADLRRMSVGWGPGQADLAAAPLLDKWELTAFASAAPTGEVNGHPILGVVGS